MGLINLREIQFDKSGWTYTTIKNGLSPSKEFMYNLNFKKARIGFKCTICNKPKSKYTRYVGRNYEKICVNCSAEWFENSIKVIKDIEMRLINNKEELESNNKKWKKEQIIGAIS